MNNYATLTIDTKFNVDLGKLLTNKILISYLDKVMPVKDGIIVNYAGTKYITADDYFMRADSSHHYFFSDAGYKLLATSPTKIYDKELYEMKQYHYYIDMLEGSMAPIEFVAETDEEAIAVFVAQRGTETEADSTTYYLPLGTDMYDRCHCECDCVSPCARRQPAEEKIYTMSDFSTICKEYKK